MSTHAVDPLIGVSCGHRVPRLPVLGEPTWNGQRPKLYWCSECREHRMSGGKTTGLQAFDFLLELRDSIVSHPVSIVVDDPGNEEGRATIHALGASVRNAT